MPPSSGRGGGLTLETHSRLFSFTTPDGKTERVRALTVFLVNRRATVHRYYADVSYAFQARLELGCEHGFRPRRDLSGYNAADLDLRIADLHYRDVREWAVGRNAAAGWDTAEEPAGIVTRVWTDPLPTAEVERVAPNEDAELKGRVTFGMETLAELARADDGGLRKALADLPVLYGLWIDAERKNLVGLAQRRREAGEQLITDMETAKARIASGIDILTRDARARAAFRFMNLAVARAARRRYAGAGGDPAGIARTAVAALPACLHPAECRRTGRPHARRPRDRRSAVFPNRRRQDRSLSRPCGVRDRPSAIDRPGVLGAGVAVIMRYTLRLLTLDQLARAAGVVCALELMRTDAGNVDEKGRRLLGDWPIEIGLWVGSDASPNRLGGKGRCRRNDGRRAGAALSERPGQARAGPAEGVPLVRHAHSRATPSPACRTIMRRPIWKFAATTRPATSAGIGRCPS